MNTYRSTQRVDALQMSRVSQPLAARPTPPALTLRSGEPATKRGGGSALLLAGIALELASIAVGIHDLGVTPVIAFAFLGWAALDAWMGGPEYRRELGRFDSSFPSPLAAHDAVTIAAPAIPAECSTAIGKKRAGARREAA